MTAKLSPTLSRLALTDEDKAKLFSRGVRWDIHQRQEPHGNASDRAHAEHKRAAGYDEKFRKHFAKSGQ